LPHAFAPRPLLVLATLHDAGHTVTNATVQTTGDQDPLTILTAWVGGAGA